MQQVVTKQPVYKPGTVWNKTNPTTSTPASGLLPPSPSCQPCPQCGGLECLCRPRFFAGQLLSEQDLNRLDNYILAKNRLHNRYLVGHGVVCGLQVSCDPCGNAVSVSPGYAIDPCGNDIIVCSPDTVDVCSLINACTPSNQINCGPYKDDTTCRDATETWILAISYQESPSRGITPLTGSSQCSCGSGSACTCGAGKKSSYSCTCGGAVTSYGCSCGGQSASTAASQPIGTKRPRRGAPPTCEPIVTCETYRYEVFPAPPEITRNPVSTVGGLAGFAAGAHGAMFANMACCMESLFASLPAMPIGSQNPTDWVNYLCNLRLALIRYAITQGGNDCEVVAKLRAVDVPGANSQDFVALWGFAFGELIIISFEFLLQCFCNAVLPPCAPPGDPRVPLAAITVRAGDCSVVSVCNWTTLRKHVVTNVTLGYWLGWLPFVPNIRKFMQSACCAVFNLPGSFAPTRDGASNIVGARREEKTETDTKPPAGAEAFVLSQPLSFGATQYSAGNPISEAVLTNLTGTANALSFQDLANALFTPATPAENGSLAASPHAKVLAEILRPLANGFAPLLGAASGNTASTDDMAAMRAEIDNLKSTVATQQSALDALQQQQPPPRQG